MEIAYYTLSEKQVCLNQLRQGTGGKRYSAPPPPYKIIAPPPCSYAYVNGLLSSFVIIKRHVYYINGVSLLDRRGLIRVTSVIYCESQTTSQRACQNLIVYVDTWEKVEITPFFPSDMMHVHFATHKVARKCSGSVVECLTRDRRAAGSSLTGVTALCPWARTLILA